MAKFDIKDKAFRNLIEERDKFYGLKSDEFQKLNNAVDQYKKSNFFAKLFNVGDAKKAQKEFEEFQNFVIVRTKNFLFINKNITNIL